MASLYETDFQKWVDQTVEQLKHGDFENLDLANLIDEVEGLGINYRHSLSSYLRRLCEHLLKVQFWSSQRERCLRGWSREIINFRVEIEHLLESSPSLRDYLTDNFQKEYRKARKLFLKASGLSPTEVPEEPCFTLEQALEEDWLPDFN